jgi:hypothetical protein
MMDNKNLNLRTPLRTLIKFLKRTLSIFFGNFEQTITIFDHMKILF